MPGYTDSLVQIMGVATQGETAAADVNREDMAAAEIRFPGGATILEFGAITTELWDVAGANAAILSLQKATVEGGSFTSKATITFPKAGTATNGGVVGARLRCSGSAIPLQVKPGELVKFVVTQAATDLGGAFIPYIIARLDGFGGANSAAPMVEIAA